MLSAIWLVACEIPTEAATPTAPKEAVIAVVSTIAVFDDASSPETLTLAASIPFCAALELTASPSI